MQNSDRQAENMGRGIKTKLTRNQHASPPRQCNTGRPCAESIQRFWQNAPLQGRESNARNFTIVPLEMWTSVHQNPQNMAFWHKSAHKGPIPLSDFYKIWRGEGVPGPHPHANCHRCCFKMWAYSLQNLWYKFTQGVYALKRFLQIWRFHVSIFIIFVIRKRDKQTNKQTKNITFFRLQLERDPRSPPYLA